MGGPRRDREKSCVRAARVYVDVVGRSLLTVKSLAECLRLILCAGRVEGMPEVSIGLYGNC